MKTKIKFPFVERFQDYHDIKYRAEDLNDIFVSKIKCKEVAFDGCYYGLFYMGKLPAKQKIRQLCLDAGWHEDYENADFLA